eukprot:4573018-Pyramimonas_sp.AAC.1
MPHHKAWCHEKKRRRAAEDRKKGAPERAAERKRLGDEWRAKFDSTAVKEEEYMTTDQVLNGMGGEVVDPGIEGKMRVCGGNLAAASAAD